MCLVQPLFSGSLDIVGDIHGEYAALVSLLAHLGYDEHGNHPDGRRLVFVGDMFDRGPSSPQVYALLSRLHAAGKAQITLGNHELNVLRQEPKDGTGWYFDSRIESDLRKYAPFDRLEPALREPVRDWLDTLPVALEREDLRVVHAAWLPDKIEIMRQTPAGQLRELYNQWQQYAEQEKQKPEFQARLRAEKAFWPHDVEDPDHEPPMCPAHAEAQMLKQMSNPVNTILAGVETPTSKPFYASGKWRFCERVRWWDHYDEHIPVIIGHYWRRFDPSSVSIIEQRNEDVFAGLHPYQWHGKHNNVFCIDYSVGGRWQERKRGLPSGRVFKLAAMRWPERLLCFEDGSLIDTMKPFQT